MLFVNFVMGLSRFESSLCLLMIIKVVKAVLLPIVPPTSDLNDISSNGHMAPLERVLLSKDLKRESSLRPRWIAQERNAPYMLLILHVGH